MDTILVATDFSDHATSAIATATALARHLSATLRFVHAVFTDEARPNAYELSRGQVEDFRRLIQEDIVHRRQALVQLAAQARDSGVEATHELLEGQDAEQICRAASEHSADLIVLGSRGSTGLRRILLGSVAERVVREAPCSVLVARPPAVQSAGFHKLLVPTDFGQAARSAFQKTFALAAADARIVLMHSWFLDGVTDASFQPAGTLPFYAQTISSLVQEAEAHGAEWLDDASDDAHSLTFRHVEGRPSSAIQSMLQDADPAYDLVAVGTHGRSGVERLLLGSVAESTVRYSPCSVLGAR